MEITNDDITYAEKILLKNGETFDNERRDFIKNLDTIDLQAVPGSGKTTALLAKLLILERKMPFSNGTGILVLSHTNTAVDEIKEKLEYIAPKLFKFPNFIGTIQSFVDEFLAKPYIFNKGYDIYHIDTERQIRLIEEKSYLFLSGINIENKKKINHIKMGDPEKLYKTYLSLNNSGITILLDNNEVEIKKPKGNTAKEKYIDYTGLEKKEVRDALIRFKLNLIKSGNLSYEDAYFLGQIEIKKFPKIIKLLQARFGFVFVDEMQDMGNHQVSILEQIFYKKHIRMHCFQRIGDKNQAIYGGEVKIDSEWKGGGRKILKLTGTHRLTKSVANMVKYFGIDYINFIGNRTLKNEDGLIIADIKPILLVYKTIHLNTEGFGDNKILLDFSKLIYQKKIEGYFADIKDQASFVCKAIIWNAKPQITRSGEEEFSINICRAKHYFFDYDVMGGKSKNKTWFGSEKDYLYFYDKSCNSLGPKYKNIINLLLRILRSNDIKNPEIGSSFTKKSLVTYLGKYNESKYIEFQEKLYNWTKKLNDANIDQISNELDDYFVDDLIPSVFGKTIHKTIGKSILSITPMITSSISEEMNMFRGNDIDIQVCTVHSVKGETHTCTLYLESSSNGYESTDKIKQDSFLGIGKSYTPTYGKQAMKMLYVGLSRPTHLLCYAIHEDRYQGLISGDENKERLEEVWDIKFIS